jgi:hypothetical protein
LTFYSTHVKYYEFIEKMTKTLLFSSDYKLRLLFILLMKEVTEKLEK